MPTSPGIRTAYPSPRSLLQKYDLRAKKSWGQNFLADRAILDAIARLAARAPCERVVELGAGLGHLTVCLVARGARVVAVERDRDMARVLRGELGEQIALFEADASRLDYEALARSDAAFPACLAPATAAETIGSGRIVVTGNLPYHLTSPILFRLLDQSKAVKRAVFLLQREVAERLAATPGTKEWGLLSVLLQERAEVTVDRIVPPGAFHPAPKVESAVLLAEFRRSARLVGDSGRFRQIVKAGFAQRRKMLSNALRAGHIAEPQALARAFAVAGIDPGRRGETLTVAEWAALDSALAGE